MYYTKRKLKNNKWGRPGTRLRLSSLVPSPEEEEEKKGPGFSRSRMRLIISDFKHVLMSGRVLMMLLKSHGRLHDIIIAYSSYQTSLAS